MAHKKGAGSSDNGRESRSRRLGFKKFGGESVIPGNIILRQVGTRFHPKDHVGMGKDHTLYAKIAGKVSFAYTRTRKFVSVIPHEKAMPKT